MEKGKTTFLEHLLTEQEASTDATGQFTVLLTQISRAAKIISGEVCQAGLVNQLGYTGGVNIQGEEVKKLDRWSNEIFVESLKESRCVCVLVSEEMDEPLHLTEYCDQAKYMICFDPIDGSSNIDVNGVVGSIFSIHRRNAQGIRHGPSEVLRRGTEQIAAGYVMYGPSTLLVFTAGRHVNAFTLDPNTREFVLSHPNIQIPKRGKIYSINEGYYHRWQPQIRKLVDYFREIDKNSGRPYSLRYVGSLVADLHRTLLEGGVYLYPAEADDPKKRTGKLRLLYEAAPLALITEVAGGKASTGGERILDIEPSTYHQRVPLIIGSAEDVTLAEDFYQGRH